ncbi:MAG: peptidase M28, partial [Flavobacteriaceae bacterium]|nr:peptidase M28 [Flavobacteriaceae bacterium]
KKLTAANAINLASLAWAPPAVKNFSIGGIVQASVKFKWEKVDDPKISGYKIYWRDTTSPNWQYERFVGDVNSHKLKGIVIDNFFFGISTVGKNGFESEVVFPNSIFNE